MTAVREIMAAAPVVICTKGDQYSVTLFFLLYEGASGADIYGLLCAQYGESASS